MKKDEALRLCERLVQLDSKIGNEYKKRVENFPEERPKEEIVSQYWKRKSTSGTFINKYKKPIPKNTAEHIIAYIEIKSPEQNSTFIKESFAGSDGEFTIASKCARCSFSFPILRHYFFFWSLFRRILIYFFHISQFYIYWI